MFLVKNWICPSKSLGMFSRLLRETTIGAGSRVGAQNVWAGSSGDGLLVCLGFKLTIKFILRRVLTRAKLVECRNIVDFQRTKILRTSSFF